MRSFASYNTKGHDESLGRLFSAFLILNILNLTIKQSINISFITNNLSLLLGLVYIMCLFHERRYVLRAINKILVLEVLFAVLLMISVFRYPSVSNVIIKRCLWTLLFCIPLYAMSLKVTNRMIVIEKTKKASFIVVVCVFLMFASYIINRGGTDYNMSMGYAILYPALYHLSKTYMNRWYWILVVLELVIILVYGSRGPLLCFGVFFILFFVFRDGKNRSLYRLAALAALLFFLIIFFLFSNHILSFIAMIISHFGIQSRTLNMLLNSRIALHGTREVIWRQTWVHILEKPLFGWGIAGELSYMVSYPHLVFLELLLHYGVVVGLPVCISIVYRIIVNLIRTKMCDIPILILLCSGFVPLLLSDTYLNMPSFWILLAFCSNTGTRIYMGRYGRGSI